ncbi:EF-P beta-lysylation protein EpmB [Alkanindiges sp. WGS2144]|uniref:EF-P beta-lysylation protein EpmB n=1 Tax=Alkanindiges sp. WGS2144 TaxID=3366808 RepID=UPI003753C638
MINYLATEQNWQNQLNDLVTSPVELLNLLDLPEALLPPALSASQDFALRVPKAFVKRMQKGNPDDPLLLQVLPLQAELEEHPQFILDPLGEKQANAVPGILHKYKKRLLLTLTGACAVHCRYCFRRHFPYQDNLPKSTDWPAIKQYIESQSDINEVVLSGGDPLSVSNRRFAQWLERLESIAQLKTLRIHTRLPIVLPDRLDDELLTILNNSRFHIVMVVHCNHPAELDNYTKSKLLYYRNNQILMLNQTVLLRTINDNIDTLVALSEQLFECQVLPYYLHVLDKVKGAAHFDISEQDAVVLYQKLMHELPGYLLPKLVREIAGKRYKVPLNL